MTLQDNAKKPMNSSSEDNPAQAVLDRLKTFYMVMGNAPETPAALVMMAEALAARAAVESINTSLNRCMLECHFPIRLPDIFQRIPGLDVDCNAEKRLAWETVERFVAKWARWNSERIAVYIEPGAPQLAQRILDTVRRSGGWSSYLAMTDEDFPHQQKRFFEEYQAWTEIQHVAADPSKLLEMPRVRELAAAKTMEPEIPKLTEPVRPEPEMRQVTTAIYTPLNADQLRDRATVMKIQLRANMVREMEKATPERRAYLQNQLDQMDHQGITQTAAQGEMA